MCDYSLDFVASRPAKVGDKLVTTKFKNSVTRGFAAVEAPTVAVCVLPGTEIAFEQEVEYCHSLLPNQKVAARLARFRQINLEQAFVHHDALEFPQRKDHSARPTVRRSARDRAAVAGFSARHERSGAAEARFSRYLIGPRRLAVEAIEIEKSDRGADGSSTTRARPQNRIAAGGTLAL